jgi:putative ABC transport system permease protein
MFRETLTLAARAIRRSPLRSFLTILGVVIGVGAVIAMVTLGSGTTASVTANISKLGTNRLSIRPGRDMGPGAVRSTAKSFTVDDVNAIASEIAGLAAVAPTSTLSTTVILGNQNWTTSISGTENGFFDVRQWQVASGRQFTDSELRGGTSVCIIGATIRKNLFGLADPIGQTLRLEKFTCKVVGLLVKKGEGGFGNDQDDIVLTPLKTFQRRIAGDSDVDLIDVSVRDARSMSKAKSDIDALLRERRHIRQGADDDFNVFDMTEIGNTLTNTSTLLTGLLGAVAAVSLLVGGIGIMNIMLVSVTERTREIGIRLAVGALASQVLAQFLVEAIVLSVLGGVIGIALGLGLAAIGSHYLKVPFIVDPGIVLVAFLFSAVIGIVFGFFPARRAANLNPIEALRHE